MRLELIAIMGRYQCNHSVTVIVGNAYSVRGTIGSMGYETM